MSGATYQVTSSTPWSLGAGMGGVWKMLWPPPLGLLALWGLLWLNLNTGPWLVARGQAATDLTYLRVYGPFGVLIACGLWLAFTRTRWGAPSSPLAMLGVYGLVGLAAGIAWSPAPEYARYWSVAYLATVSVCFVAARGRQPVRNSLVLMLSTWVAVAIIAAGVTVEGAGAIFGGAPSAYWIITDLQGVSRSSGVARWTGITALVAMVWAFYFRSWVLRAVLLGGAGLGLYVVYRVQSRGAVFGIVAAILFLLCLERRRRRWAVPLLILAIASIAMLDAGRTLPQKVVSYLKRDNTVRGEQNLYTMGGRTTIYSRGWKTFQEAPVFGRGFWADRLTGVGHVHNGPLAALLVAGAVGFVPYLWSWIAGWRTFLVLWRHRRRLTREDLYQLTACGAVLAFLTVRSIPETTGANYEPDLLILCAVYAYLEAIRRPFVFRPDRLPRQPVQRRTWLHQAVGANR